MRDKISYFIHVFQASGRWTGEKPHCEPFSDEAIIIFTISVLAIFVTIVCLACYLCERNIKVVLFMKFGLSLGQRLEMCGKRYDVYIIYDQDGDGMFVENELISLLQENKLKVANIECTTLGIDVFSALETMLKQSRTALVVITERFLKTHQNLYHLNQAVVAQLQQKNFKVAFLLCQKVYTLGKLPTNLSLILKLGTTIKKYKGNWQNSLVYEVTHKTQLPLSKRLSFRNKLPKLPNNINAVDILHGTKMAPIKRRYSI